MIQRTLKTVAFIVVLATGASVAIMAQEKPTQMDKAVKARKAVMQIYSFNLGLLSAMAKEEMDYDAQTAINAAWNINAAALMKNGPMWPQGSGNDLYEDTRALSVIWSSFPKVAEHHEALTKSSEKLVGVAGNGLAALKGELGNVGKSCKGCHDDFRAARK